MKNTIARLVDIRKIELFEEDIRPLKDGELLIEIGAVGICGSDIHYFKEGGLGSFKQPMPFDIGHEPAGQVVDSKSLKFFEGDKVAIEPGHACLKCDYCKQGKHNLCEHGTFMGATAPGAFAKYVIIHEDQAFKISEDHSYEFGALLEPLGIACHAFNLINPPLDSTIAIFGSGPIGLCLTAFAKKLGFSNIIVTDKLEYRLGYAKHLGATQVFECDDHAVDNIKDITGGKGADYVFDAAGFQDVINKATMVVKPGGHISLIGIPEVDYLTYNPHKLRTKEVVIHNVRRSNQTLEACYNMFKDDGCITEIVTHRAPLEDIEDAFNTVSDYKDGVVKYMIEPN